MSAMTSCGFDHGHHHGLSPKHDLVARFAEPALEQFPNEVVGFDNDDATLRAHEFS